MAKKVWNIRWWGGKGPKSDPFIENFKKCKLKHREAKYGIYIWEQKSQCMSYECMSMSLTSQQLKNLGT